MDAHLRDLRYFVSVADELSFTRAAERLHLSQPALSKQIRVLERTVRARLFDRDRRQVRLTAAGEVLLAAARRVLADWDDGTAAASDLAAQEQRTLRVGTLTAVGHRLYRGVLDRFAGHEPGWRIDLRSFGWDDPTAGLADRVTDAAFLWLPAGAAGIESEVLLTERRFAVLSSEHPLAGRTAVTFRELAGEPFVALPVAAGALREFWLGADGGQPAVRVVAEVRNADEKFEVVSAGRAIALVAEGNAEVYSRPGIVCIPVSDLAPASLAVAWRAGEHRSAVRAFVKACTEAAADAAASERREER
jgi:DNA-binding transcriptional LysR family regulator